MTRGGKVTVWMAGLAAVLCMAASAASEGFYPFYENLRTEQGSFFAVRPFYSHTVLEEGELRDYLWPLYSRKSFKEEETSRALIFWFTHRFNKNEETPRQRRWLLPFWFQGRDANGESYFALFPLGGTIREFLGRDTISFALFPMFGKSQVNEVRTTSVLWPVYSRTRGDGIARDRVFPMFGKSVLEGKYEKRFVLWPIWNSAEYFYPGNSGTSWILFPLCGRSDMEHEQTLWLVPPFFRFTKGERRDMLYCPWPFIQKIESERHRKLYVWPLWGHDQYSAGLNHRTFLLWPFFWSERSELQDRVKTRRMAVPFFVLERDFEKQAGVPKNEQRLLSSYWKIWPLMSWQKEGGNSRLRILELWPVKNSPPVERNWSPLWTLYKRTHEGGLVRKDVLWFAWHSERDEAAERTEWSLLKGLVSYKNSGGRRSLRLLYLMRFEK